MIFRVAALLLFWWLFRVRWLAVVLSAATWGFLHSSYPQMPGYVRGIELTIVGIVWGTLLLRYGIVATLTAHYLYDCWLGSIIAFQSSSWENKVGRHRGFRLARGPLPLGLLAAGAGPGAGSGPGRAEGGRLSPAPTAGLALHSFGPGWAQMTAAIVISARGRPGGLSWIPKPQDPLAELGKFDLSRAQIEARADALLGSKVTRRRVTTA